MKKLSPPSDGNYPFQISGKEDFFIVKRGSAYFPIGGMANIEFYPAETPSVKFEGRTFLIASFVIERHPELKDRIMPFLRANRIQEFTLVDCASLHDGEILFLDDPKEGEPDFVIYSRQDDLFMNQEGNLYPPRAVGLCDLVRVNSDRP